MRKKRVSIFFIKQLNINIMKLSTQYKRTMLRDYIFILNSMGYEVRDLIGKPLSYFNFTYIYNLIYICNEEFFKNNKCYYFSDSPIYQNCFTKKLNIDK